MKSDEDYLKSQLYSLKLELDEVRIQRRITTMEINTKESVLTKQIESIEAQLGDRRK
jgi:hypothetical protein